MRQHRQEAAAASDVEFMLVAYTGAAARAVYPGADAPEIVRTLGEVIGVIDALGREESHGHRQVVAGALLA
jgi:hypothetical protein